MVRKLDVFAGVGLTLCTLGFTASAQQARYVTLDAPGAVGGTEPVQINLGGTVAGYSVDGNGVFHGFLRSPQGKYTMFDVAGAGTNPNASNGTFPAGINVFGVVAGYYNDANVVSHGFVRSAEGKITTFDAPGADTNPADAAGTIVSGMNDLGAISGYYSDTKGVSHGFVRSPGGKFTSFDAPGAGGYGTYAIGPLNLEGAIVGFYTDTNFLYHAFVRNPDGQFATFVGPGSCDTGVPEGCYGSGTYNINLFGTSVGAYQDNSGNFVSHGFVRTADGKITTFEAPGAGTGTGQGTGFDQIAGLNITGAVTANYLDGNDVYHGFLRAADGKITTFDAPGADLNAGDYAGTTPVSLNDLGVVAGYYVDSSFVVHGFLRFP
ncbi:MAG: hypothetical protein ABSC65_30550 [Acidobacteriaceae bacterium]|jgi:hypothetical protein